MTFPSRRLGSIPPLLAGMAAAVAVETSAGVLLYIDDGLLPALTLVLSVEMGAFALGLWSGSLPSKGGVVEKLRRRWLFSLVTFALAAALSAGLSFLGELPGTRLGQGVGLGFLGALPLFSLGALLGALSGVSHAGAKPLFPVGAPSAFGAALGLFLVGNLLLPNADPYTLYLLCLVALSGGALLQGLVLDGLSLAQVLESVDSVKGEIRVESRTLGGRRGELKVLLDEGRIRGAESSDGNPGRRWETGALEAAGYLKGEGWNPESVLLLGGGSGTLARLLSGRFPEASLQVVERSLELVRMARAHFLEWNGWDDVTLEIGELVPPDGRASGTYSLTVVDCSAFPELGGGPFLRDADWEFLGKTLAPCGILVLGGLWFRGGRGVSAIEALEGGAGAGDFSDVRSYMWRPGGKEAAPLRELEDRDEGMMILTSLGAPSLPSSLGGFLSRSAAED